MTPAQRSMLHNALRLSLFALVTTGMIAGFNLLTADRIAASQQQQLEQTLNALVPAGSYDNDLLHDTLTLQDQELLGQTQPETAWRARRNGQPVAILFPAIAPDGYSGRIRLLVAIRADGSIAGVRTLAHKETPGLGDAIDSERSDWIKGFNDKSLYAPAARGWHVRKDGGDFDQFTGATITPRAVVKAVHNALLYYRRHQTELFAPAVPPRSPAP